jgi:hypothetical protein
MPAIGRGASRTEEQRAEKRKKKRACSERPARDARSLQKRPPATRPP